MGTDVTATVRITMLRHGRSRADDEQVHEGHYDSPLTEVSRAQAAKRAAAFVAGDVHFDCVVSSTLQRARETASILASTLNAPVEHDPDW